MRVGRLIDECISHGAKYADCMFIVARKLRVDYLNNNFVTAKSSSKVYILRALVNGSWGISVALEPENRMINEAIDQALSKGPGSIKLADRRPIQGGYVICQRKPVIDGDGSEISNYVRNVTSIIEKGPLDIKIVEGFVEASLVTKTMMSSDGVNAYEVKPSLAAIFTAKSASGGAVSTEVHGSGGFEILEDMDPQSVADEILSKLSYISKSKPLNPYYRGSRFEVILSPYTAASVIQVVVESTLNAKSYKRHFKQGCESLNIVDDPTLNGGYGSFFFDDEGVKARRKKLLEAGKLISLLHSRETAYTYGVEPTGNGRGLAEPPQPRHSNIVVEPCDWSFEEMVEETRMGLLIDGVKSIQIIDDLIVVEPEVSLLINRGEITEAVKVGCFVIGLYEFYSSIKAIGSGPMRSAASSISECKMASYSPPMKVEVRVFV
ncbi:MAG: TldD/PmbA family protein [Candidatus Nezhaarchaeota archaeon]|nr:TldD/PmbA family protein [Candidatus Nezhaarchaeota archaeon]